MESNVEAGLPVVATPDDLNLPVLGEGETDGSSKPDDLGRETLRGLEPPVHATGEKKLGRFVELGCWRMETPDGLEACAPACRKEVPGGAMLLGPCDEAPSESVPHSPWHQTGAGSVLPHSRLHPHSQTVSRSSSAPRDFLLLETRECYSPPEPRRVMLGGPEASVSELGERNDHEKRGLLKEKTHNFPLPRAPE